MRKIAALMVLPAALCVGLAIAAERVERHVLIGPAPDGNGNLYRVSDYSDRDNDGIEDANDECPDDATNRCNIPDTDGDGFKNDVDECPDVAGPDNGCPPANQPHAHWETLKAMTDKVILEKSFRDPTQYLSTRGTRNGVPDNPENTLDVEFGGVKTTLNEFRNESTGSYMVYHPFTVPDWVPGKKVYVSYECMVGKGMADYSWLRGSNGRYTANYKAWQITSSGGRISHEHRIHMLQAVVSKVKPPEGGPYLLGVDRDGVTPTYTIDSDPDCHIDWRNYAQKRDGRWERDEYAAHRADPSFSGALSGGGYDSHPSPFSEWAYKVPPQPHPGTFRQRTDKVMRVTCEFECVRFVDPVDGIEKQGRRSRVWVADEDTDPVLLICNPTDPSKGFLHVTASPPDGFWIEFDTSQETIYDVPQPERSVYTRNLIVMHNIDDPATIVGGRPVR
jgi:hypothetical protein